jgi:hypothetical protein
MLLLIFGLGLGLILFGLMLVPLRGWFLAQSYSRRLRRNRDEYLDILRRACNELIAHGLQLRRDATGPFTRLIETQSELLEKLRTDLEAQQQALLRIQGGLASLEKR